MSDGPGRPDSCRPFAAEVLNDLYVGAGNIATFQVPGDFTIVFTGMRVTGHDGVAVHHLVGVKPDVAVSPTLAGIRAGRDEVLDRALSLMR